MTKTVLAIIAVIAVATSLIGTAVATDSWVGIVDGSVVIDQGNIQTTLSLTATDDVPRNTSTLAGYAWFTSANTGLALTTHNAKVFAGTHQNPARDSNQNPDGWHAHNVVLGAGTVDSTFCVTDLSDAPTVGLKINGDNVTVKVRTSATDGTFNGGAAAFHIQPDAGCTTIGSSIPLGIVV